VKLHLDRTSADRDRLRTKVEELEKKITTIQATMSDQSVTIKVLQYEKKNLQSTLDFLEADDKHAKVAETPAQNPFSQRLKQAQATNQEQAETISQLQQTVVGLRAQNTEFSEANSSLQKKVETVENENMVLIQRLGNGDYDAITTKIVHFKENPLFLARQKIAKAEVLQLQDKINKLEMENAILKSSSGQNEQIQLQSLQIKQEILQEREKCQAQVAVLEKKLIDVIRSKKRWKEVFEKKFIELMKVTRLIFGFRIEVTGDKHSSYKLFPPGGGPDSYFFIDYDGSKISVLDNDYIHMWEHEMAEFLGKKGSFPGFMASVVLAGLEQRR